MYRFTLPSGLSVQCDTPAELFALNGHSKPGRKAGRKRTQETVSAQGKAARRLWNQAKREAKRQGRQDVAAVRSELVAKRNS